MQSISDTRQPCAALTLPCDAADGHTNNVSEGFSSHLCKLLACADTEMSGLWVRGSGADSAAGIQRLARSVITWPRVCEGCPTYGLLCQPYKLSPVSRLLPPAQRVGCLRAWRWRRSQRRSRCAPEEVVSRSSQREVHPHVLSLQ
jgi:hypothetical protein